MSSTAGRRTGRSYRIPWMSSAPPTSLLISPDLRRQLQQHYEDAQRLATRSPADFRRIHELLAECVWADPGNILYLDALVANLRQWQPKQSWLRRLLPGATDSWKRPTGNQSELLGAHRQRLGTEYALLQTAAEQLKSNGRDPAMLRRLAEAAAACDLDQAEVWYLELAAAAGPGQTLHLRGLAEALTRQGRFEQ